MELTFFVSSSVFWDAVSQKGLPREENQTCYDLFRTTHPPTRRTIVSQQGCHCSPPPYTTCGEPELPLPVITKYAPCMYVSFFDLYPLCASSQCAGSLPLPGTATSYQETLNFQRRREIDRRFLGTAGGLLARACHYWV